MAVEGARTARPAPCIVVANITDADQMPDLVVGVLELAVEELDLHPDATAVP